MGISPSVYRCFSESCFAKLFAGYLNQNRTPCINESLADTDADTVPTTPPPSYEHVLEEVSPSLERMQLSMRSM